ncbi:hypothetical protein E4U41_002349 [Claviceps citrina]|nr:hypothetical protein E4U41_002349 [Claviceps citrina]
MQDTRGVPTNAFLEIEDAEEWERPTNHHDLVHARCLEGAFRDWHSIYHNIYDSLKPGGWVQVADMGGKDGSYESFAGRGQASGSWAWLDGQEAYTLRTLTEVVGWDPDVAIGALDQTAREIARRAQDEDLCKAMNLTMRVVVARKPEDSAASALSPLWE